MNYSKDSRSKKIDETNKNTKKKKTKKAKVTAFRVVVIALVIGVFAVFGAGLGIFMGIIKSAPDVSTINIKPTTDFTSFVYDQNGVEIDRLSGGENRIYAKMEQIPQNLQDAVVAIEDARFYEHNGIDIRGIMRAIVVNLKAGDIVEGASTITQQVIKNNALTSEQTFVRKIQEQYLALQIDALYDKELILEYYLNTMPLGHGTNGVQAAANRYFGKDVSELSLAECAVIAGITQAPTRYSPIRNPENNWDKAKLILSYMQEQGYITEEERQAALLEDPYKNIQEVNQKYEKDSSHSYFVDAVIEQVIDDLVEQGMTPTQANNLLFGGGVEIYTTLDQDIQRIVDNKMADDSLFPSYKEYVINYSATIVKPDGEEIHRGAEGVIKSKDEEEIFKKAKQEEWGVEEGDKLVNEAVQFIPQAQAAFVISDPYNGHVKALSGGRGMKYGDRTFNRATQAKRQPGSCFKVLAAYAPALDLGLLSPGSVLVDEPYTINKYSPKNWRSYYKGPTTIREAIWDSMNVLAVKTIDMVGIDTAYNYLLNFGFTTLSDTDKVYSLPLGGLTDGVTPLELNAAYAAIANQGTYTEPLLYTQVLDRNKEVILDNTVPKTHTVIKPSTASMLTDMMEDVVKIGTGTKAANGMGGMPVSGKTGTTSDNKDFLFAGYTPYYTATVWMGYDRPQEFTANGAHLNLWSSIMSEVHKDLPNKDFELVTTGYTKMSICSASGKIPTELCSSASDNKIVSDYFQKNQAPSEYCDVHVHEQICSVSGKIATEFCPQDSIVTKVVNRHGEVSKDQLCDVHTQHTEIETPDDPQLPEWGEWPWGGGEDTQPPTEGETIPPTTPDQPVPPTTPGEPVTPNPDDESGFFIPQG
ncbi:transglycosylase domain-containing protein [Niameybacter massiliensis]|uniref:transglycosylase domain-containing protein n=1 Tax=Niameybacter massiliensis TaxID=1658108 RepID=UPI0006B51047|nr:PBP1A family penicillin-binding protein [Niameybacter massiliensis]